MVSASKASESDYLNVDIVRAAAIKEAAIIGAGEYKKTDYGDKLVMPISIDGKEKSWRVNRDSALNCISAWGEETSDWVGKTVKLKIVRVQGKDTINAEPKN